MHLTTTMLRVFAPIFVLLSAWGHSWQADAAETAYPVELCHGVRLTAEIHPGLSDVEKRLVCGDPKDEAWRTIPFSQAKFHLRTFLQERAYLFPEFDMREHELRVNLGRQTLVTSLTAEGAPESLRLHRKRKILGYPLTPALLSDVEKWVSERLQAVGYPCPKVTSNGDPDSGAVKVLVNTGPLQNLMEVSEGDIPGVAPGVIRRYDAFRLGKPYNGDWARLTERRITDSRIVESARYSVQCKDDGAVLQGHMIPGPPRLLILGAGINTEGILLGRATWKNTRMGNWASSMQFIAQASTKLQSLTGTVDWYAFKRPTRYFIQPLVDFRHENEESYETLKARFQVGPAATWDSQEIGFRYNLAGNFEQIRTLRGQTASRDSHFLSLGGGVTMRTHEFEYYLTSPRTGYSAGLEAWLNDPSVLSEAAAQRLQLRFEGLWNLREYDPPLIVFGLRGGAGIVSTNQRPGPNNLLPPTFMQFLGGSINLRGYGRQELPRDGAGRLTSAFGSFEIRLAQTLPLWMEPFVFADAGVLGYEPWVLDSPVYWSPGVGLRVQSPVGVFRGTLAHGYPSPYGHWQGYVSFGEEF